MTRALRGRQPPRGRARLTLRERAAWFRLVRRHPVLRQLLIAARQDEIRRLEQDIDRLGRQLREHLGLEGGET